LLTTLRRVQKKADPIVVKVRPDLAAKVQCVFPSLPSFAVALVNQDWDKLPVHCTAGGDYRSGRQARWRFEVRDERGRTMPVRESYGNGIGGGLFSEEALPFGGTWETELVMSSFVPALPPGQYSVRILYHNCLCISGMPDVKGLITSQSAPITLVVAPAVVELTDERRRMIRGLLEQLDTKGRVSVVAGSYGEWAHELVPPDSPQGKLLAVGIDAVPVILSALRDKELNPHRRAVMLSVLFSVTGQNDPTYEPGVIGNYSVVEGPWSVWGGNGGGLGLGGSGWGGGWIDPAAQLAFAKRWEPWNRYIRVQGPAPID
jgi:hypothetical protein